MNHIPHSKYLQDPPPGHHVHHHHHQHHPFSIIIIRVVLTTFNTLAAVNALSARDTVHSGHLRSSVLASTFIIIEIIFSTIFSGCCPLYPPAIIISISINIIMFPTIERIMIMYHNIMMMSHPFFQFSRTIVGDFEDTSFVEV